MIQLAGSPEPRSVSACAEWSAATMAGDEAACAAVEAMLHMGGFHGRRVTLSIPYGDLTVVPALAPSAAAGDSHARHAPTYCWPLASMQPVCGDGTPTTLLIEASTAVIEQWRHKLHRYGAAIEHFQPRPLAVFHSLQAFLRRRSDRHHTHVLIDVAPDMTAVLVASGVQPYFLKCSPIGERDMVAAAAKRLSLTVEDIRQLRQMVRRDELPSAATHAAAGRLHAQSDPLAWAMFDATRDIAEKLVFEIGLCLKHCQSVYGAPKVETAWLSGEAAEDVSLHHLLLERAGLTVHVLEPLRGLDMSRTSLSTDRRGALAEWAVGVGAARFCADSTSQPTMADEPLEVDA
jgi:hypothetical protein